MLGSQVAVVIVNFNAGRLVECSLKVLAQQRRDVGDLRVVVVDNNSSDGSVEHLVTLSAERGWQSWLKIIDHQKNDGFAAGNNVGVQAVWGWAGFAPSHVLFLNPDACLCEGALLALMDAAKQTGHGAILGGQLVNDDGLPRASAFRFPGIWTELQRGAGLGALDRWLPASRIEMRPCGQSLTRADWVTGAVYLVPAAVLRRLGPMNEQFFLYYEEVAYQREAARKGIEVWTVPAARVKHWAGSSTGIVAGLSRTKPMPDYWYASWQRYFFTQHGKLASALMVSAWVLGRLLRCVVRLRSPASLAQQDGHSIRRFVSLALFKPMSFAQMPVAGKAPPLPDGSRNENPSGIGLWALIREDFQTHDGDLGSQGFWTLAVHRLANWRMEVRSRWMRYPLTLLYRVTRKACQMLFGIKLDYTVRVGRRVKLEHFGGMILGARAIGDDVVIRQNTTFGVRSVQDRNAKPTIGSRVDIGAGAVIVGDIHIGDDVVIGANSVVHFNVPSGARVRAPRAEILVKQAEGVPLSAKPSAPTKPLAALGEAASVARHQKQAVVFLQSQY